jgi:hypothetical protein
MFTRADGFVVTPITIVKVLAAQAAGCCHSAIEVARIPPVDVVNAYPEDLDQPSAYGV